MSDYRISFTKAISIKDAEYFKNMLSIIDGNDKLTIVIEEGLFNESDKLLRILHENNFDCKTSPGFDGTRFMITATKDNISETGIIDIH